MVGSQFNVVDSDRDNGTCIFTASCRQASHENFPSNLFLFKSDIIVTEIILSGQQDKLHFFIDQHPWLYWPWLDHPYYTNNKKSTISLLPKHAVPSFPRHNNLSRNHSTSASYIYYDAVEPIFSRYRLMSPDLSSVFEFFAYFNINGIPDEMLNKTETRPRP